MPHYYLGIASDGRVVSRKSTRPDFTHAAVVIGRNSRTLPNFSTSAEGARRNFESSWAEGTKCEIVPVRLVTAKEFKAAKTA